MHNKVRSTTSGGRWVMLLLVAILAGCGGGGGILAVGSLGGPCYHDSTCWKHRGAKPTLRMPVEYGPSWNDHQHDEKRQTQSRPQSDVDIVVDEACDQSDHPNTVSMRVVQQRVMAYQRHVQQECRKLLRERLTLEVLEGVSPGRPAD